MNVLLAARDAGVRRVVFASSSSVYGDTPTLPKREDMPPAPISPYGVTKLVGELYGQGVPPRLRPRIRRLALLQRLRPAAESRLALFRRAVSVCQRPARRQGSPTVYGDGEQSRDFTFVQNVAEVNVLACEAPGVAGMAFNVGTGGRYTLNETLRLLEKFAGRAANAKYAEPREGDIRDSQADISLRPPEARLRPARGI